MRHFFSACVMATALAGSLAAPAVAQTTITTGAPSSSVGPLGKDSELGNIPTVIAQTFVAPTGSSYLQSFSFYLTNFFNGGMLKLDASVYAFSGDHLTGSALFSSGLFNGTDSFDNETITFGGDTPLNIQLSPGNTYALVLSTLGGYASTPDGSTVLVGGSGAEAYASGSLFISTTTNASDLSAQGGFFQSEDPSNAAFSATFSETETSATPEPASFVLMATGLAVVGGLAKRRRRRHLNVGAV